ncbi:GTPase IMAP family member 4-like isoform X2 [Salarias fasciatus]|uniref:GTPase IMAP family member 4-like isoform X2 n=1 Tax=Salarias fasciatus TaxID=181472 RepID=UPI001176CE83|nr:GTPase IMAP family member 4-like isoform X2 [Salarias fasciatus]
MKSITECSPGPHAFLILLKVEKYTEQESQVITKIREFFSEEAFKYAVLVFTHGDQLDESKTIKEFVRENEDLIELLDKCGGRCHVVDNKYWNNNQFQIRQLLYTIHEMVEQHGGGCYTIEMLQAVERNIQKETTRTRSREETAASKNKIKITNSRQHSQQVSTGGSRKLPKVKRSSQPAFVFAPNPLWDRMKAPLRVILLGKIGTGKSQFGNALIEEKVFEVDGSAYSGTSKCQAATKRNGEITVVDTPGLLDNRRDEADLKSEIMNSMLECSPGPHAFLIVLKVEKFNEHEKQIITKIKNLFSKKVFKYAVLVFTHGDQLAEGRKIKEFVSENKDLKELSDKCGGRCHVVDNKYWNNNQQDPYRNNQFQIRQLLNTINEMVEQNGGGCYNNELLQAVERNIREETKRTGSREEAKKSVWDACTLN